MKFSRLGEFEELVLLTIGALNDQAYSVSIKKEIQAHTGRSPGIGALHSALSRLEKKGFVSSFEGGATKERGGRRKRYYHITGAGKRSPGRHSYHPQPIVRPDSRLVRDFLDSLDFLSANCLMALKDQMSHSTPPQPPKWAERFLEWFCKEEYLEILKGDVHELFAQRVKEKGVRKANLHFVIDVLDLFRPFAWKQFWKTTPNTAMIRHHFRASFRHIWLHKGPSMINLIGLCLGMICAMCLFLKVRYELSFNAHYPNEDQIYRLVAEVTEYGNRTYQAGTFYPMAEAMKVDFPEIEAATLVDGNFRDSGINIKEANGERKQFKVPGN